MANELDLLDEPVETAEEPSLRDTIEKTIDDTEGSEGKSTVQPVGRSPTETPEVEKPEGAPSKSPTARPTGTEPAVAPVTPATTPLQLN